MKFPKEIINKLDMDASSDDYPDADTAGLVNYCEYANARIKELEEACNNLMLKIRMIAQCLK